MSLENYPSEIYDKIEKLSILSHERYTLFLEQLSKTTVYSALPRKYFPFLIYAVGGLTNKEVAKQLGTTESSAGKQYTELYNFMGIENKKKLIDHFLQSVKVHILDGIQK